MPPRRFPAMFLPDFGRTDRIHFNLYGYFLYDDLDGDIVSFMSENAETIDVMIGKKCNMLYFENPKKCGEVWKKQVKEVYGDIAAEYLLKLWKESPYDRNQSHLIADELKIDSSMFPCIIFLKDLNSKICSKPYPLINDVRFYRKLCDIVKEASQDTDMTIEMLDKKMGPLKRDWFIPKYIGDRVEIFQKYSNPIISLTQPFIGILSGLATPSQ